MSFARAFTLTVGLEGGYSNDPYDPGGETKYGISKKQYPNLNIKDLTLEDAKNIYFSDYWSKLFLDQVEDEQIQAEIFDTAVNCGRRFATECTQKSIEFLGDEIKIDGDLGPVTLSLINKWCQKDPRALHVCLNGFQFVRYIELVEDDDKDYFRFARGWVKRISFYY